MFGPQLQRQARAIAENVVRPIAQIGISPDTISLLGIVFNGIAALVLATGSLRIGGALVLFAGVFDMFDGAVARVQQRTSLFGAFLDSTLDRYAEGAVLLGIAISAMHQPIWSGTAQWVVTLAFLTTIFSLLVSYTRARAEGLGLDCKVGLMERPERVIVLGGGLLFGGEFWLVWVLAVLAVSTGFTGLQRILYVWRQSQNLQSSSHI